ncbi:MAG: hypothetical protein LRY55_12300 [Leadbetterella sp.]|nr:hypothetical protein [Leadbetterella sp.]
MDFNNIWKAQAVPGPDLEALYEKIKGYRAKRLRKVIFANISLILTSVIIVYIGYASDIERLTTWGGVSFLTILAMAMVLVVYNRMIPPVQVA